MQFTGDDLYLIYEALGLADTELHNQIAMCPNVYEYEEDIEEIGEYRDRIAKLRNRIEAKFPGWKEDEETNNEH